ncbi:MAG: glycoside hydrolase family 92 protein [Deltaproteobacteria bacterium]|nr:glycoside hydrolase family 92 protein [Nannocystaceae bacterium]
MQRAALFCVIPLLACRNEGAATSEDPDTSTGAPESSSSAESTTTGDEPPYEWPQESLFEAVDPIIGSGGVGYRVGTVNPGATVPFGMIKPGPDTGVGAAQLPDMNCTGYHYDQTHVWGFSHSRVNGMGVPDYGAVLVTPTLGIDADKITRGGARSSFDHDGEQSSAGYYAVDLVDVGVHAELTATTRVALHRYTWDAATDDATVIFDLGYGPADGSSSASSVEIDPDAGTIRGMTTVVGGYSERFGGVPTYFAARTSKPFARHGVWDDAAVLAEGTATMAGQSIGGWLGFELEPGDTTVELALAISYVSIEQAEANLAADADGFDFDGTRAAAEQAWDAELHRVRVAGGTDDERRMLYTALYHAFLAPTIFTEADGSYRGFDDAVHDAGGATYYSDFSLWDTYRTLHPLFNLVQRDRQGEMMASLVRMAADGGDLPKWPLAFGYTDGMVGTSADIVLADAVLAEIPGFDADAAYAAARLHATEPRDNDGRADIEGYIARGWVSTDVASAAVSNTLEFSLADRALSEMARKLGETEDAQMFKIRAEGWRKLYEPDVGFIIGRRADASYVLEGFDSETWLDIYAEGTAWHYLWAVPHDALGLAAMMGGAPFARDRLAEYMQMSADYLIGPEFNPNDQVPYYWHANEPSLHDAYLFTEWGDPASTQQWVDWARREHYGTGADGLPGNDDAGTMSAWYVWSTIGLYPQPGVQRWWITAPVFERVELDMGDVDDDDRKLTIIADGAGPGMIYVAGASFDGEPLDGPVIEWDTIRRGGTLRLELQDTPSEFGVE